MKNNILLQLFLIFLLYSIAFSQNINSEDKLSLVLSNMKVAESGVNTLEVDYKEEISYAGTEQKQIIEGQLKFLKAKRFFILQKTPQEQRIYINSNLVTVYTPSNKQAIVNKWGSLINSDFTPIRAINFATNWDTMSKTHKLIFKGEDKNNYWLDLSPIQNASWRMSIHISKEDNRPNKMLLKNENYTISIFLSNYNINRDDIDKTIFEFIPPKGIEIIKLN